MELIFCLSKKFETKSLYEIVYVEKVFLLDFFFFFIFIQIKSKLSNQKTKYMFDLLNHLVVVYNIWKWKIHFVRDRISTLENGPNMSC